MGRASASKGGNGGNRPPAGSAEAGLQQLRQLLLGPEIEKLEQICRRLDDPDIRAREVGQVLAVAFRRQAAKNERIARALQPVVEKTLYNSVRKNPQALVDAIFPVMGPAIRKYISATIMAMIQSLNRVANTCATLRGIGWRIEAWKTRRPFSEIVLLHTLQYRVEQVFLIHAATGLLLCHVAAEDVVDHDPDLVSGMLTAIQDFVQDALGAGKELIDTLRLGSQRSIWLEQSPKAILAVVIQGTPALELRHDMQDCLDRLQLDYAEALDSFSGDTSPFAKAAAPLKALLQFQVKEAAGRSLFLVPALVICLLLAAVLFFGGRWYRQQNSWQHLLQGLRRQPGIVITMAARKDGRYLIEGLRDPLAASPEAIREKTAAVALPVEWRWQTFWSADRDFVLRRAKAILKPPPQVRLTLDRQARLLASGYASHDWIVRFRVAASALPGISGYDDSQIVDLDHDSYQQAVRRLESKSIYFAKGGIELDAGQEANLEDLAAIITRLVAFDFPDSPSPSILVIGHTDASGSERFNLALSRLRAEKIISLLVAKGLEPKFFAPLGLGVKPDGGDQQALWRSVTFAVH